MSAADAASLPIPDTPQGGSPYRSRYLRFCPPVNTSHGWHEQRRTTHMYRSPASQRAARSLAVTLALLAPLLSASLVPTTNAARQTFVVDAAPVPSELTCAATAAVK